MGVFYCGDRLQSCCHFQGLVVILGITHSRACGYMKIIHSLKWIIILHMTTHYGVCYPGTFNIESINGWHGLKFKDFMSWSICETGKALVSSASPPSLYLSIYLTKHTASNFYRETSAGKLSKHCDCYKAPTSLIYLFIYLFCDQESSQIQEFCSIVI